MAKKLVDITREEWGKYEWILIEDGTYIKGFEKNLPPICPDDGFMYDLRETTCFGDSRRSWKWERRKTYDDMLEERKT